MTGERPEVSPERKARSNRIVLGICAAFFALFGVALGVYAVYSYQDYSVRTSPPGGHTSAVEIEQVTVGQHCATSGKTTNCSPEYTLAYAVDGTRHTTPVRIELHVGDQVHAFEGSDGRWHATEDPGFGNSRVAWMLFGAGAAASVIFGLICLRSRARIAKPT